MELDYLDQLARSLASTGSRRRFLGLVAGLSGVGGLVETFPLQETGAAGRRKRRKKRHKHGKGRKRNSHRRKPECVAEALAQTCAGTCGRVLNNCQKHVDCGSCACDPACGACFTCLEDPNTPGSCVVDPAQEGQPCGGNGKVCQPDGSCTCIPLTECPVDLECGTIPDGCGGEVLCATTCSNPAPVCVDNICVPCETSDQCPGGELCNGGICEVCDVTCTGTAAECGTLLQSVIAAAPDSATLRVCPGTYQGGFSIDKALTVIGAGEDEDPDRSTILKGATEQRVLFISNGTGAVTLQQLHITGGHVPRSADGGGIRHDGTRLVMNACTVAGNQAVNGGGIEHNSGILEMTRCTVRDNFANRIGASHGHGGGIFQIAQATLTDCLITSNDAEQLGGGIVSSSEQPLVLSGTTVIRGNSAGVGGGLFIDQGVAAIGADCRITENTARSSSSGGGVHARTLTSVTVTLEGPDPSPIVVDNCSQNCVGEVPKCQSGGTCPA